MHFKNNNSSKQDLSKFLAHINKLTASKKTALFLLLFIALIYPGQNTLQTIMIRSGEVVDTSIPISVEFPISDGTVPPPLSSYAAVVRDVNSKSMILAKNPNMSLLPASTTKIMTAIVTLDHFQDLSRVVTISNEDQAIGHEMGLLAGEKITIKNLMYGLLVESGNDAAFVLANNYPGGYNSFVKAMNTKAKELDLIGTTYKNPSGVEQYGHVTTARDLAILASYAVNIPTINQVMQTKSITVSDISGSISHYLKSTNELLGEVEGVKGLKTGWTENAGECLVAYVIRDNHPIVIVVLKSQDRFSESSQLIEWTYNHHNWEVPELDT